MRQTTPFIAVGSKAQPAGYRYRTERYEHFQLIYVSQGVLYYAGHGERKDLGPRSLAFLRKQSTFRLWTEESGYRGVFFSVIGDAHPVLTGSSFAGKASVELQALARCLEREHAAPSPHSRSLQECLGWAMTWMALRDEHVRAMKPDHPSYPQAMVESARQALEAAAYTGRSAREILAALPWSYRHVSRLFARNLGASPKQYLIKARISEAQKLLAFTGRSVTEIAYELGYSSSQHFASQFQACVKKTPSAFRRHRRKDPFNTSHTDRPRPAPGDRFPA